jgi:hypothetical protein
VAVAWRFAGKQKLEAKIGQQRCSVNKWMKPNSLILLEPLSDLLQPQGGKDASKENS